MKECSERCNVGLAIVEDERELVKVYLKVFSRRSIVICFVAYDGPEAIKKYIECTPKPHVLIMDYRLPLMNGIEVAKKILKVDPEAKIVFLSADAGVKDEAMAAGAFEFLKKPVSIRLIVDAVERGFGCT
ncbi:MAG TPA: response regulator [Methanocella sp.]|uniref:response regulator transcription factor n=1 Tax=Methanocella sp. TaxID=2052833 RepID=UPI002BFA150B|nr:response regulator [Methanocella sp.]HTY91052.1 response regulator [Methanocella sp.]